METICNSYVDGGNTLLLLFCFSSFFFGLSGAGCKLYLFRASFWHQYGGVVHVVPVSGVSYWRHHVGTCFRPQVKSLEPKEVVSVRV